MKAPAPTAPHRHRFLRPLAGALLLAGLSLTGCADNDACKGHSETCLSLTLSGADGVTSADELQIMLMRKAKPELPMMALGSPQELPFKVAVLWPDGPASISVRALLAGKITGVSPEFALDLRNGQHQQRKLTLYPPLPGVFGVDMAMMNRPDLSSSPRDLSMVTPDMVGVPDFAEVPDLAVPPLPDLAVPPLPDMAVQVDEGMPSNPDL